jgi:threonine dehydratase
MQILLEDINKAADCLKNIVKQTELQYSARLSNKYGAEIYLKREDQQLCRSFKVRGAYNRISSLSDSDKNSGVVCASAGNHAQGVAYSCAALKIQGVIFMPVSTPLQKIARVRDFGREYIEIITTGDTFDDANTSAKKYCEEKKATFVHPFDDYDVICGQATVAKEIHESINKDIDFALVCIGGGGLASGVSSYFNLVSPNTRIIGVEPAGAAGMTHSIGVGSATSLNKIDPFVDGAAVKLVGDNSFAICHRLLDSTIVVPEGKICTVMLELYQNEGIVIEPAGALAITALDDVADKIKNKVVVCVVSGGNNDILRYPDIMERSLVYQGLKHYFILEFNQKPGQLRKFVAEALGPNDDIVRFEYMKKTNRENGAALVGVELTNKNDFEPLVMRLNQTGLNYRVLSSEELLYSYII